VGDKKITLGKDVEDCAAQKLVCHEGACKKPEEIKEAQCPEESITRKICEKGGSNTLLLTVEKDGKTTTTHEKCSDKNAICLNDACVPLEQIEKDVLWETDNKTVKYGCDKEGKNAFKIETVDVDGKPVKVGSVDYCAEKGTSCQKGSCVIAEPQKEGCEKQQDPQQCAAAQVTPDDVVRLCVSGYVLKEMTQKSAVSTSGGQGQQSVSFALHFIDCAKEGKVCSPTGCIDPAAAKPASSEATPAKAPEKLQRMYCSEAGKLVKLTQGFDDNGKRASSRKEIDCSQYGPAWQCVAYPKMEITEGGTIEGDCQRVKQEAKCQVKEQKCIEGENILKVTREAVNEEGVVTTMEDMLFCGDNDQKCMDNQCSYPTPAEKLD
jgi:hypothetical protein